VTGLTEISPLIIEMEGMLWFGIEVSVVFLLFAMLMYFGIRGTNKLRF
jgi:hypothetical protein